MSTRVFVVDDHEIVRVGLRKVIGESDCTVVGESDGGESAIRRILHLDPDVIVMDIRLPISFGLRLLMEIKLKAPAIPILIYSRFDNPVLMHQTQALSASGFLVKSDGHAELLEAIDKLSRGATVWKRESLRRMTGALATPRLEADVPVPLTKREGQVLSLVCEGLTNREIASRLQISYETVKEHVQHILVKIGVADRTQAAVWAVRHSLV